MKYLPCYSLIVAASLVATASIAAAAPVKAPPLPPGSAKVKLHPGQNPKEIARDKHAHQRPKKDKALDDTRTQPAIPAVAVKSTK